MVTSSMKSMADHGHHAGERADFGAGNFGERAAAMSHGSYQNDEILNAACQHSADQ